MSDFLKNAGEWAIAGAHTLNPFGWGVEKAVKATSTKTNSFFMDRRDVYDPEFVQDRYKFNYRVFPEDLGNEDMAHYMVININTPTKAMNDGMARSAYTGPFYRTSVLTDQYSKVDILRFGQDPVFRGAPQQRRTPGSAVGDIPNSAQNAYQGEQLAGRRATRRIEESIALFMPTPVVYTSMNDYPDTSIGSMVGGAIMGAINGLGADVKGVAGKVISGIGSALEAAPNAAFLAGYPINPRVAVLYATTPLRQFNFEILMAPKSQNESVAMEEIITTLRQHAAPEIDPETYGFTWIPPAEFDITFYYKGAENMHIPRISTCVLNRIDVDYAPTGAYSTFHNGFPVSCRLTLQFMEIEVLHKRRVLQGF
jgi:hypothetical protein